MARKSHTISSREELLQVVPQIIEKINAWPDGLSPVKGAALFFTNDKAPDTAFQARTIAELMGV